MKYVCKSDFEINDILVGNKGDVLEITDPIPRESKNETWEDVAGYCDIHNLTTGQNYDATWNDVDDTLEEIN